MKELDLLRQELLSCDTQLADILMKRFDVVEKIMALKENNQMQILQPEQESRQQEDSGKETFRLQYCADRFHGSRKEYDLCVFERCTGHGCG